MRVPLPSGPQVYHELAQEISDYFILTSPTQGALKPPLALLLNFLSGFSVLFGVLIVLEAELTQLRTRGDSRWTKTAVLLLLRRIPSGPS